MPSNDREDPQGTDGVDAAKTIADGDCLIGGIAHLGHRRSLLKVAARGLHRFERDGLPVREKSSY